VVIVVFGVSSAGKTTIGKLLARQLGWDFYDADDFHSTANIDKMTRGVSLTDEDRQPWLTKLRGLVEKCLQTGEDAVLACSALKKRYRDYLRVTEEVRFVFLRGDREHTTRQFRQRHGHFMNQALLESQFADLEEPQPDEQVLTIEPGPEPAAAVDKIKKSL